MIAKTPLIFYFNYLAGKKTELEISAARVRAYREEQGFDDVNKHSKEDAIKDLIPNWKAVQQDEKAKDLCDSLGSVDILT